MAKPTVSALGEIGLIRRIARQLRRPSAGVRIGIGDDTAVIRWTAREHLLFASDMLVEGVHFRLGRGRGAVAPRWVGWKALAANVSDVASMGGLPRYAVVSLGLPARTPVAVVDQLYQGIARCASTFGVAVVGGDTVRAPQVVVDVAILGTVKSAQLTLRSGAKVGDQIFVTGRLGGSLITGRHATFVPRVAQAQWLVSHVPVGAMMDVSDGLASDLWQIARAGRVTCHIEEARIPVSRAGKTVQHALMDGEDYELVFTVPARAAARVPRLLNGVPVTRIGTVLGRGAGVFLVEKRGRIRRLVPQGYRHF